MKECLDNCSQFTSVTPEENQMDPGNDSELLQTQPSIRSVAAFVLDIMVCLLRTNGP